MTYIDHLLLSTYAYRGSSRENPIIDYLYSSDCR